MHLSLQNLIDILFENRYLLDKKNINKNVNLKALTCDSREASESILFFLFNNNNLEFLWSALKNGGYAIVNHSLAHSILDTQKDTKLTDKIIFTSPNHNTYKIYSIASSLFFNLHTKFPLLKLCAVTGTNGKSSIVYFYNQLCAFAKLKSAYIGTLGCSEDGDESIKKKCLTTPDAFGLHSLVDSLASKGIMNIALEASSHGLHQYRLNALKFCVIAFTNLSQDHLDYHKSMQQYWQAKCILFNEVAKPLYTKAVINIDDPKGLELIEICTSRGIQAVTYSLSDWLSLNIKLNEPLVSFQMSNLLCALKMFELAHPNIPLQPIIDKLSIIKAPPGRMQIIKHNNKNIYIDHAHTPEGLQTALKSLREIIVPQTKIILIFGCGGDRDKLKRPIMGSIACEHADIIIITADNPRSENISDINNQILSGINHKTTVSIISDRLQATKSGISILENENAVLLIAGKGHEKTQIFRDYESDYNDYEIVKTLLSKASQ